MNKQNKRKAEEILDNFLKLGLEGKLQYIYRLFDRPPEGDIEVMDFLVEVHTELVFLGRAGELEDLVTRYCDMFPGEYEKKYEFIELALITYYLVNVSVDKAMERLLVVRKCPVAGVDTVTIRALYLLIFYGHYRHAVDYAKDVWKPVRDSREIFGLAHSHFCMTIYLDELENAWMRIHSGEKIDWDSFMNRMGEFGLEKESYKYELIGRCMEYSFNREEAEVLFNKGKKEEFLLVLNVNFLKFMKERFGIPFILSDNWWNMLASEKLYKRIDELERYFQVDFDKLKLHFSEHYDSFLRSNNLEMFGRAFGLKYVYFFLYEYGMITGEDYKQMKQSISALEYLFEKITYDDLWKMVFISGWPALDPADPERDQVYKSTFSLYEGDFDGEVYDYLDRRLEGFPSKLREQMVSVLQ